MPAQPILSVALPTPLRRLFDYLPPENYSDDQSLQPGIRVKVPFGHQELIGVLISTKTESELPASQLKPALIILDDTSCLSETILHLCQWAANYYHHPLGEVMSTALPVLLRQGEAAQLKPTRQWQLTALGRSTSPETLARARRQQAALRLLQEPAHLQPPFKEAGVSRQILNALAEKGLAEEVDVTPEQIRDSTYRPSNDHLPLNDEQATALSNIDTDCFGTYLLEGTTGSGKTEVYLQAIDKVLALGKQALVLVPEIGLTPQTLQRFQQRFDIPIAMLHSGMNDSERLQTWLEADKEIARIIIGTRSAIWTPAPSLGIIIIDEEHDLSFKQQDGLRYSARDLAAIRAQHQQIPLLLGSATPSLESLHNAHQGRYHHLQLRHRAGNARPPKLLLQDIRSRPLHEGFSDETLAAIKTQLDAGHQVLVFINRRGFAPTLMCHDCGWQAHCHHCDARLTLHQHPRHLRCHHCDYQRPVPQQCPQCVSHNLTPLGVGTERSEAALQALFPGQRIIRVDRDSTRRKNAMQAIIDQVHSGEPCILVGTQMLAKGHHFPDVTLVVILDADGGLFSADFRGAERMGQLLIQVAGRAGRAEKPGDVIIQTHLSDHPLLQTLNQQGYPPFAQQLLHERQLSQLPPYRYMALLRAEAKRPENALGFLTEARRLAQSIQPPSPDLAYLGPLPAPMEKRNQRFRYQLQLNAASRGQLHRLLLQLIKQLEGLPLARRTRWSVDVDPLDPT